MVGFIKIHVFNEINQGIIMNHSRDEEAGLTLPELLIYVAILTTISIFVAGQFGNITDSTSVNQAHLEIEKVRGAARSFRSTPGRGDYTGVTIAVLANNGYSIAPFTDGLSENVYDRTISIAPTSSNEDAVITYVTDEDAACNQLIERYTGQGGIVGTPVCTDESLALTID